MKKNAIAVVKTTFGELVFGDVFVRVEEEANNPGARDRKVAPFVMKFKNKTRIGNVRSVSGNVGGYVSGDTTVWRIVR